MVAVCLVKKGSLPPLCNLFFGSKTSEMLKLSSAQLSSARLGSDITVAPANRTGPLAAEHHPSDDRLG